MLNKWNLITTIFYSNGLDFLYPPILQRVLGFFNRRIKRAYHELRINYKFSTTHICLGSISEVNIHTSITSECFYKARICLADSVYCNSSFPLLALLKQFIFICNILMRHDYKAFEVLKDELHKRQSAGFT